MGDYLVSIRFLEQPMSSEASTRIETENIPQHRLFKKSLETKQAL